MTKDETVLILRHMSCSLPNFNYREDDVLDTWHSVLKEYDYEDTFRKINALLEEDRFQYQAFTPQLAVRDLRKISEKTKLNSYKVYCKICGRLFNSYDEEQKHFDRCSSVEYIIREYPKWYPNEALPDKKRLYNMSENEFNMGYLKLLKRIYENTLNENERIRIGNYLFPEK